MFDRIKSLWRGGEDNELAQAMARADDAMRNGDFAAAAQWYAKAIEFDAVNANALVRLGFCLIELGRVAEAEAAGRQAAALAPKSSGAHFLAAQGAKARARMDEAVQLLHKAVEYDPGFEPAYRELCLLAFQAGKIDDARQAAQAGLTHLPQSADLHFFLANIHHAEARWEAAVSEFEQAVALAPGFTQAYINLGLSLQEAGRSEDALKAIDAAVALAPDAADTHLKRGYLLQQQKQFEPAFEAYRKAVALQPALAQAHANLGSVFEHWERWDEARQSYQTAAELEPGNAGFHFNLGALHQLRGDFDEALAAYHEALRCAPHDVKTLINTAAVLDLQGKPEEALHFYDTVLALHPELADAHVSRGYLLLRQGRFAEGWRETEYRWQCFEAIAKLDSPLPEWRGSEDLQGKSILVYGEQGFGDMMHFVRYAALLAERGASVYLLFPASLRSLAASCPGVAAVFTELRDVPPVDFVCPLMSLPLACGTEVATIPAEVPYLHADPAQIEQWRARLGERKALRVGLVWSGAPHKSQALAAAANKQRSIHFDRLLPLLEVPGVAFYSLQVGDEARSEMQPYPQVIDLTPELRDFRDTAGLIQNLDLVISVDTSVVHLTGALGKPVWMLDRFAHCYRWLPGREDSPWYPSIRIFRQEKPGDWDPVVARVRRELERLAAA